MNIKDDTLTESHLQKFWNFSTYPWDSVRTDDKRFVKTDIGKMSDTHCTCFYVRGNESYYFESFGGPPDKLLLKRLPKPFTFHHHKVQEINSNLSGTCCLNLFYLKNGKLPGC